MTYETPALYETEVEESAAAGLAVLAQVRERLAAIPSHVIGRPALDRVTVLEVVDTLASEVVESGTDSDEDGDEEPYTPRRKMADYVRQFAAQDAQAREIEAGADPGSSGGWVPGPEGFAARMNPPVHRRQQQDAPEVLQQKAPELLQHPYVHSDALGVPDRCCSASETIPNSVCWKTEVEHEPAPIHLLIPGEDSLTRQLVSEVCRQAFPLFPPSNQVTRFLAAATCKACLRAYLEGELR